jgi:hypothetical protein
MGLGRRSRMEYSTTCATAAEAVGRPGHIYNIPILTLDQIYPGLHSLSRSSPADVGSTTRTDHHQNHPTASTEAAIGPLGV